MTPLNFYRALVILNGAIPTAILAWDAYRGELGANSANYALHVTGTLSLIFLFLSLCMTPLRWLSGWGGWVAFRRSLGLFGFFYACLHVVIYVAFDRNGSVVSTVQEIWMRRFLQVGTAAVFLMVPLAITSTNQMIQRLGPARWKGLHRLAYVVAILGVVHYYMLVKSDVRQPLAFAGVLSLLLGFRFGKHYWELRAWRNKTASRAPSQTGPKPKKRAFWSGELRVVATFQETPDVRTFRLGAVDGGPLPFEYRAGQYMNLQLMIDGKRVNRSYTIASSPTRRDTCELTIKREPRGTASRYIHDHWAVGSTVRVSAPAGGFVFSEQDASRVLMIAGGVGITPLMSMIRSLTDRGWMGDIYFLVIAKTEADLIFREEIEYLRHRYPRLHVCMSLTRAEPEGSWSGQRGRANAALLHRLVPNLSGVPVFLCGPNEMMDATRALLVSIGVPNEQVKTEAFVSPASGGSQSAEEGPGTERATPSGGTESPGDSDRPPGSMVSVSFARSKREVNASTSTPILETAEEEGVPVSFECRSGICGQCKTKLLQGKVTMECEDALSATEKSQGYILACQAHPTCDVTVDL